MTGMVKILTRGVGLAALTAAVPATAQYVFPANVTQVAADRCAAAVQHRLSAGTNTGILGMFGIGNDTYGRVLSVTQVVPRAGTVRVRGLATSNAYAPYGVGAYGMLGSNYAQPDLSFRCTVDYRGYVRDVDINRRY